MFLGVFPLSKYARLPKEEVNGVPIYLRRIFTVALGTTFGIVAGMVFAFTSNLSLAPTIAVSAIAFACAAVGATELYHSKYVQDPSGSQQLMRNAAIVGLAIGLPTGIVVAIKADLSFLVGTITALFVTLTGGALAVGVTLGARSAFNSDFVRSSEPRQKHIRNASKFGAIFGLVVGMIFANRTGLAWYWIVAIAVLTALIFGALWSSVQDAYSRTQPSRGQLAVRVGTSNVPEWKLRRIQAQLKVGQVPENTNEKVLSTVTEFHWMKLVVTEFLPGAVCVFFIWGATGFRNFQAIGQWLTNNPYNWYFVLAAVALFCIWLFRNRKRIRLLLVRAVAYGTVIILVWLGLRSPGGQAILDAFRTGSPLPWLLAAFITLIWCAWRWLKWVCGFAATTDKRAFTGAVLPFPLPNFNPSLLFPANSSDPKDTLLGNLFGYGHAIMDGAGTMDWLFNDQRYLKDHRRYTASVISNK